MTLTLSEIKVVLILLSVTYKKKKVFKNLFWVNKD